MRPGVLGLGLLLVLTACGDDDTATPTATATAGESSTTSVTTLAVAPTSTASATTADATERVRELAARSRPVRFDSADGTVLRGRLFGDDADRAVVLSHMGRRGDSQEDWFSVADQLARRGVTVLTYDRRGVCSETIDSCSDGNSSLSATWQDVVGAVRFLDSRGVEHVVVGGASIGAMATWRAVTDADLDVDGVIWFAGVIDGVYSFDRDEAVKVDAPALFLAADDDSYGAGEDTREMNRWRGGDDELVIVPGSLHGTDLLTDRSPPEDRRRLTTAILDFVDTVT